MTSSQYSRRAEGPTENGSVAGLPRWGAILAGSSLAVLGLTRRSKTGVALAAAGGALAFAGARSTTSAEPQPLTTTLLVNCSPQEAYRLWRDFENLPLFMPHLVSVKVTGDRRSRWVAATPLGTKLHWEAEIDQDRPGELISWHSLPSSEIHVAGSVAFQPAPAGRGTLVRVVMEYRAQGAAMRRALASFVGRQPAFFLRQDLRRFKALVETGEIPTTEGQPHGPRSAVAAVARAFDPTRAPKGDVDFRELLEAERSAS